MCRKMGEDRTEDAWGSMKHVWKQLEKRREAAGPCGRLTAQLPARGARPGHGRPAGPRRSPPSLTLKTESSRTEKVASHCFDTSHANGTFSLKDIKKKPFGVHPNVHFPMSPPGLHARINSYFTLFGCNEREILERTARWQDGWRYCGRRGLTVICVARRGGSAVFRLRRLQHAVGREVGPRGPGQLRHQDSYWPGLRISVRFVLPFG